MADETLWKSYNFEITLFSSLLLGYLLLHLIYILHRRKKGPVEKKKHLTRKELLASRLQYFEKDNAGQTTDNFNQEIENNSNENVANILKRKDEKNKKEVSTTSIAPKKEIIDDAVGLKIVKEQTTNKIKIKKNESELFLSSSNTPDNLSNPVTVPLKSLEQLMTWTAGFDEFSVARVPRRAVTYDKDKPKTLVCHDMRGGYVEDRFPQGFQSSNCYRFTNWNYIDSFCYFTHNFISIPPPNWTNAAHTHGVKVFGTLITEWTEGAEICQIMLLDDEQVARVVKKLVDLAVYYQFDGWLINIENEVMPAQIDNLVLFLQLLTLELHEAIPGSEVIWYDSVLYTGQLKWQNRLCTENRIFFDACDGIFLNYNWSFHDLQHSLYLSGEERRHDVYVGVDVFGRGCYGGGGWNTNRALQVIREKNLSAAIFAPGWVIENCGEEKYTQNDKRFWDLLLPYMYVHKINELPLSSSLCQGYGNEVYLNGKNVLAEAWTNLSCQSLQPTFTSNYYQLGSKESMIISMVEHTIGECYKGGGCYKICGEVSSANSESRAVFRLFQTDIHLDNSNEYILKYTHKLSSNLVKVSLLLLFEKTPKYMVFSGNDEENVLKKFCIDTKEEFNYEHIIIDSQQSIDNCDWVTRSYKFKVKDERLLQEIRLVAFTEATSNGKMYKENFELFFGELYINSVANMKALASACNFRYRNSIIKMVDARKICSFTLTWDYNSDTIPKCYDLFIHEQTYQDKIDSNSSDSQNKNGSNQLVETALAIVNNAPLGVKFVGRAFADSYHFSDITLPHEGFMYITVVSISQDDIRQSFKDAPRIKFTWVI